MAAERYLSRRIPDLRVGNNIDEIDKKLIPASIHPWSVQVLNWCPVIVSKRQQVSPILSLVVISLLIDQ